MRQFQNFCLASFALLCSGTQLFSNSSSDKAGTRQDYIAAWKDEAIYQMVVHKIPASITLAQGILESGDGNSRLAREGNNHFGIKCHNDWTGKTIIEDDETRGECFRKYDNARESYEDHSAFLQRKRYESLFKLDADDYKAWARGLKQCGYATNPKYPDLLIGIIEEFGLTAYDKQGLQHIKEKKIPPRKSTGKVEPEVKAEEPVVEKTRRERNRKKHGKDDDETRTEITISNNREISRSENNIKYVIVKPGESLAELASDLEINERLLRRYNDLNENSAPPAGTVIYIQPKRNKAKQDSYTVKKGDSLWSISQQFGIKLKKLQDLNAIEEGQHLRSGQELKLKK